MRIHTLTHIQTHTHAHICAYIALQRKSINDNDARSQIEAGNETNSMKTRITAAAIIKTNKNSHVAIKIGSQIKIYAFIYTSAYMCMCIYTDKEIEKNKLCILQRCNLNCIFEFCGHMHCKIFVID